MKRVYLVRHMKRTEKTSFGVVMGDVSRIKIDLLSRFLVEKEKDNKVGIITSPNVWAYTAAQSIFSNLNQNGINPTIPKGIFTEEPYLDYDFEKFPNDHHPFPHYGLCEHIGHSQDDFGNWTFAFPFFASLRKELRGKIESGELTEEDAEQVILGKQMDFSNIRKEPDVLEAIVEQLEGNLDVAVLISHLGILENSVAPLMGAELKKRLGQPGLEIGYLETVLIDHEEGSVSHLGLRYAPKELEFYPVDA